VPEDRPRAPSRLSLVGFLAAVLFIELWLNRIVARTVRHDLTGPLSRFGRELDIAGMFSFELASVLVALLALGAIAHLWLSDRHRRPFRLSVMVVGGVAVALILLGTFLRMPPRLHAHLYLSAIFFILVLVLGALAAPTSRRVRLGILLLAVPIEMMLVANLLQRMTAPGVLDPRASQLSEAAGAVLTFVGLLSPVLLGPRRGGGRLAFVAGAIAAGGGLGLGWVDWNLAARLAGMGLGVAIPINPIALPIYVVSASAFVFTTFALLAQPGPERLRGLGLFVLGTIALQLELPYQIGGAIIGFICVVDSVVRPTFGAITREQWDEQLRNSAAALSTNQVIVVGDVGRERARLPFSLGGVESQLCVERYENAIDRVELSIGEIPVRAPPFSIERRGTSLGPSGPRAPVDTDDAAFDARFVVHDHRGAGTALLDSDTRQKLMQLHEGWLGVWPQRGARAVSRSLPSPASLGELASLLAELRVRSGG
jgi:hypothetical protein